MKLRGAAALALLAILGCKPGVRGLCSSTADCRTGAYCSLDGICLSSSGTCSPACGDGQICSGGTCAALKPVISVRPPAGPISPAFPQITAHVDAASAIALHSVSVEVDSGAGSVASGSLHAPQAGDNLIVLSQIAAGTVAAVSVRATLRYQPSGGAEATVSSAPVPATVDSAPPSVSVFVPPASDAINGWVPRTSGNLEVRANVDDGAGSGPQSATLSFNTCPAAMSCTYPGTLVSKAMGAAIFSFQVPRTAQAAGSEAPLPITVTATDVAGNQAQGAGTLLIDDAPPQIGNLIYVSAGGVAGEDGNTWFIGGTGAPDVEVALPVTDAGAGFAALTLHLDPTDLPGNFPTSNLDPPGTAFPDGIHFHLPASAIHNREQHLRFTLTATDLLQHTAMLGPNDPKTMIWVDDLAPVIIAAPQVDYANAVSPAPQCDGSNDTGTFKCGRQLSTTPHLLADDTVTVRYDTYDCGAGMAAAQPYASVNTVATQHTTPVSSAAPSGSQCKNGNPTHHYSFTLNLVTQALTFDPPDPTGTTLVQLAANAVDRLQHAATLGSGGATSGNGVALISLWRWKNQISTNAQPSGSAALIPGSGARQIAVGTTLPATSPNFFVLNADGSSGWHATVSNGVFGDVAAGPSGSLYMVSPPAGSCSSDCNATLNIVSRPASSASTTGTFAACPGAHVSFGVSPVIATSPERAVVASTNHAPGSTANVFIYQSACSSPEADLVSATDYPGGISANWPSVFFATSSGFVSIDHTSSGFDTTTQRAYNTTSTVPTSAPPAIMLSSPLHAVFASTSPDDRVHSALQQTCLGLPCWQDDGAFVSPAAGSNLVFTPVFDASNVYAADDNGKVYTFERVHGTAGWTADFRNLTLSSAWQGLSNTTVSAPVLLQGGSVLVVRSDGVVAIASGTSIEPLYKGAALTGPPASPVVEARGTGGVAYVHDGQGWIIALQLAAPPAVAGSGAWPRPGRDSCNSRNAASSCQ